mmetsp:Transcript_29197/g.67752  ORF Transcript_29197/g.67752 Transcript_29197/m.67752 type:complete len:345 (+) Transcript_29197:729-1763(+)
MPEVFGSHDIRVFDLEAPLELVAIKLFQSPGRLVLPFLHVALIVGLLGINDVHWIWQLLPIPDGEPSSSRWPLRVAAIPRKAWACHCVLADPPASVDAISVLLVVNDHDLNRDVIVVQHVRHQQALHFIGVMLAFAFALALSIPHFGFLLEDGPAMGHKIGGALVLAVQLWSGFALLDQDHPPVSTSLVFLVVRDNAQGIVQVPSYHPLLVVVVIIRQRTQRSLISGAAHVEPHSQDLHGEISLHQHAKAAEKVLHWNGSTGNNLQKFHRHANLNDSGTLHALRQHSAHLLLLDFKSHLQDHQRRADARCSVTRVKPLLELLLQRSKVIFLRPCQSPPLLLLLA